MWRVAAVELAACWVVWLYPFARRVLRQPQRRHVRRDTRSHVGFWLQCAGYALLAIHPAARPGPARIAAAMALGPAAAALGWWALRHLGRQFAVFPGVYADHELVRSGPYRVVRHPVFSSMLVMFAATAALLARWPTLLMAMPLFVAGTEIRLRGEERLLAGHFGAEFERYRQSTPAYLPFIR